MRKCSRYSEKGSRPASTKHRADGWKHAFSGQLDVTTYRCSAPAAFNMLYDLSVTFALTLFGLFSHFKPQCRFLFDFPCEISQRLRHCVLIVFRGSKTLSSAVADGYLRQEILRSAMFVCWFVRSLMCSLTCVGLNISKTARDTDSATTEHS